MELVESEENTRFLLESDNDSASIDTTSLAILQFVGKLGI